MRFPDIGHVLDGRYRLEQVVGEGGFGRVYRATDIRVERDVAIKLLKPHARSNRSQEVARFKREMRAIAKLESPHTLTLYDHGATPEGALYMVTDYVEGDDLSTILVRQETLPEPQVALFVSHVLDSLREAHSHGIIHRDIKPANIRLHTHAGATTTKLLDFGIARSLTVDETKLTASGLAIGTARYMSPERLIGEEVSYRSDLYSLGLVAYDALLGLTARTPSVDAELRFPKATEISAPMQTAVSRLLDMTNGFESTDAALRTFQSIAFGEPIEPPRRQSSSRRRSLPKERASVSPHVGVLASLILGLTVVGGIAWLMQRRPAPVTPPAMPATEPAAPDPAPVFGAASVADAGADLDEAVRTDRSLGCVEPPPSRHGDQIFHGLNDSLPIRLPQGYDHSIAHPVIIDRMRKWDSPSSELAELADREGIVLLQVPHRGLGIQTDYFRSVDATARAMFQLVCVDRDRVFVVGRMTFPMELLGQDYVRAAAVTGAVPSASRVNPTRLGPPVPLLHVSAQDSIIFPRDGQIVCVNQKAPNGRPLHGSRIHVSVDRFGELWRERNSCSEEEQKIEVGPRVCSTWKCEDEFVSCSSPGGARWTGMPGRPKAKCVDSVSEFPYVDVIWAFFEQVSTDASP